MKIDTENIYIVMEPHSMVEDFEEIFVDAKRNLGDLKDLFSGGMDTDDIYGIYTDRESALADANKLWADVQKIRIHGELVNLDKKERFKEFVEELEKLSNKHSIAIESIGGVYIFDVPTTINYDTDETSGDLKSTWRDKF